jgi:hypothetical protein
LRLLEQALRAHLPIPTLTDAGASHAHHQQHWQREGWTEPTHAPRLCRGRGIDARSDTTPLHRRQLEGRHFGKQGRACSHDGIRIV